METIDVEEIKKLTLNSDEYLFIRLPDDVDQCQMEAARKSFGKFFEENSGKVIVYCGDIQLIKAEFVDGEVVIKDENQS